MKKIILGICLTFILLMSIIVIKTNDYTKNMFAVVVPHHNFVKRERLEFWDKVIRESKIDSNNIEKIIIVGPDHFGTIKTNITYDNTSWTTYNTALENFFERPDYFPKNYVLDTKLVKGDHAIANLISEIHDNFSNARFVPFIIGENIKFEELTPLINYIDESCMKNCALITSVDFSHYVTLDVANKQDENTIKLLENKEIKENVLNQNNTIEADSPASLYVMQEFARKNNLNWKLYNHTNSARGNTETVDTTSHIFGAFISK